MSVLSAPGGLGAVRLSCCRRALVNRLRDWSDRQKNNQRAERTPEEPAKRWTRHSIHVPNVSRWSRVTSSITEDVPTPPAAAAPGGGASPYTAPQIATLPVNAQGTQRRIARQPQRLPRASQV